MFDPTLIAQAHGLDPKLVVAIIEQESDGDPWSIRYENNFYNRYISGQMSHLSSTEARARAFSYGLMQVMGQVARERGFTGKYLTELCDPATGVEYGCRKLARCVALNSKAGISAALQAYNGGSNPNYSSEVLARIK